VANKQTIIITWSANTETDLGGYNIYFGTKTNTVVTYRTLSTINMTKAVAIAAGHTLTFTTDSATGLNTFPWDGVWWVSITAYDLSNNESAKATPLSKRIIRTANKLVVRR
jgi:hypothetical protein